MDPATALELQLAAYRRMTGEERLVIGLRLHELACAMAREGIRHQYPQASPREMEVHLQRRLRLGRVP